MANRILMVAFHYPPCVGSSGLQRSLCFSKYLPRFGWDPIILSAHHRAYAKIGKEQLSDIPSSVIIERAFALDTAKHLSLGGRYLRQLALPDRWVSWVLGAVPAGLRLIKQHKPKVLWTTYPIASAHLIGYLLHRLTHLPWVADFRDPMTEGDLTSRERFPSDRHVWQANRWIERRVVDHCSCAVFVTPSARKMYVERYPRLAEKRSKIIPNGYDEANFSVVERVVPDRRDNDGSLILLHSGALYPEVGDRHPGMFLSALARLVHEGILSPSRIKVVLRATGYDEEYRDLIRRNCLEKIVSVEPAIPYQSALEEMRTADGLLVFQGSNCNPNIPAKLYEYFRAGRPIFAMIDTKGDTAMLLKKVGVGTIVSLQSEEQIAVGLLSFLDEITKGKSSMPDSDLVKSFSREFGSRELGSLLDGIGAERPIRVHRSR